jgi:hypothetical protein
MTWHDFLRKERKRKLKATSLMMSGHIGTSMLKDGVQHDTTEDSIATNIQDIAEIETLLEEAGESVGPTDADGLSLKL